VRWDDLGEVELTPGTRVRRPGFGGAWLTGPGTYGPPPDVDAARAVLRLALDAGVQLFDTADCYGPGVSETLIAEALYPYPQDVVVSTKGGRRALGGNRWEADGRPGHLRAACEGSLRRLRLADIHLYQLNAVDPDVPLEESVGALDELRTVGMLRHIGLCNVSTDQLRRAMAVTRICSVQNRYDLLSRDREDVLELCAREGVAFLPWFPPAHGLHAGPGSALAQVAAAHDATPAQVALAWLLRRADVVLPLPGTPVAEEWEEDLAALDLRLTTAEAARLTATG
jgi:pyridoxine 4-dehydrogenase